MTEDRIARSTRNIENSLKWLIIAAVLMFTPNIIEFFLSAMSFITDVNEASHLLKFTGFFKILNFIGIIIVFISVVRITWSSAAMMWAKSLQRRESALEFDIPGDSSVEAISFKGRKALKSGKGMSGKTKGRIINYAFDGLALLAFYFILDCSEASRMEKLGITPKGKDTHIVEESKRGEERTKNLVNGEVFTVKLNKWRDSISFIGEGVIYKAEDMEFYQKIPSGGDMPALGLNVSYIIFRCRDEAGGYANWKVSERR